MKIGVIADIHANLPALEAVLQDLPSVDQLICLGDIVGYNPWPHECLELVRERADLVLQGNHDRDTNNEQLYHYNELARAGLEFTREQLTDEEIQWLWNLPPESRHPGDVVARRPQPSLEDRRVRSTT
jgi:predicted phosphodiesterase